ncbi:acyl-CoA carboxylase epsilon subunit [Streptomyces sp. NPDC059743]|uniref:acyl-CoA carboxylase epsilon subunit n=1 Tax=Streptomyces sp. NPDC059743 TaxID=3346928 RepID=UPI003657BB62
MSDPRPPFQFRVDRGSPTGEELAALTVALLARAAARTPAEPPRSPRAAAGWYRPERGQGFDSPGAWPNGNR